MAGGDRIAELEGLVVQLLDRVGELQARVVDLEAQVAERDARIVELEKLLGDSRRAGKRQAAPFSKGDPKDEPSRPGRRSGERHGRHGHRMAPVGVPDRTLDAPLPGCCPDCGGEIDLERVADQWQCELPDMAAVVTRFRVQIGRCRGCRRRVQGRHQEQTSDALGAAGSQVGPRAKAWAYWLHYGLGLSFGKARQVLERLGVQVTAGALCSGAQSTGAALVPVQTDLVAHLNDSDVVVMDETGWRVGGESAWLWIATTPAVTVYDVANARGFDQATNLVEEDYSGVLVRDGWAPYRRYDKATHQTCVAHLLRRCHHLQTDLPAWARHTPRQVADILTTALDARAASETERADIAADLAERIKLLAQQAHPHDECRRLVKHLTVEADALFTFLTHPTVDATNWRAEQGIRPAVVNRKVWGGNRTWQGAATQGRMLSVLRTATQQGVDAIDYLVTLARAPTTGDLPPLIT